MLIYCKEFIHNLVNIPEGGGKIYQNKCEQGTVLAFKQGSADHLCECEKARGRKEKKKGKYVFKNDTIYQYLHLALKFNNILLISKVNW